MLAAILEIAARTGVIVFDPNPTKCSCLRASCVDVASSSAASRRDAKRSAEEGMNFAAQVLRELGLEAKGQP